MPLGLMAGMSYEEKEIVLDAGEAAIFYSDGLLEAHNSRGEMFGFPRLRALISEHAEQGPLGEFLMGSSTPSLGKDGSKRTISPSLRCDVPYP
jgi:Stage II sporulation protein E (SpoIIE)